MAVMQPVNHSAAACPRADPIEALSAVSEIPRLATEEVVQRVVDEGLGLRMPSVWR